MADLTLEDLAAALKPGQVLAGLDLGTKTIGVAISDLGLSLATPREVIRRRKFSQDAETLLALLERERVGGCVIGLPVNMDGSEGPRAQATRAFVRNMAEKNVAGVCILGRAAVHRCRRTRADRNGCVTQEAR